MEVMQGEESLLDLALALEDQWTKRRPKDTKPTRAQTSPTLNQDLKEAQMKDKQLKVHRLQEAMAVDLILVMPQRVLKKKEMILLMSIRIQTKPNTHATAPSLMLWSSKKSKKCPTHLWMRLLRQSLSWTTSPISTKDSEISTVNHEKSSSCIQLHFNYWQREKRGVKIARRS